MPKISVGTPIPKVISSSRGFLFLVICFFTSPDYYGAVSGEIFVSYQKCYREVRKLLSVLSLKEGKFPKKLLFLSVCAAVLAVLFVFMFRFDWRTKEHAEFNGNQYSTSAKNMKEMQKLAENFGIKIGEKPAKIENIKIPHEFNTLYKEYNALQHEIGMDLEKYKGEDCIKYSFDVNDDMILNLIVYDGNFIGGDLSAKVFGGKITGIAGNE